LNRGVETTFFFKRIGKQLYFFIQRLGKQIIEKKSLTSMPHHRISNKGNSIFFKSIIFHFLKKKVCGGGVESISPRRKAFKILNTKFGVVILNIMIGKVGLPVHAYHFPYP
jgi:hypothetical protein